MDNDDIGALGQTLFQGWCTAAGMIASPPSRDKLGWDFHVQMPLGGGRHDAPERSFKVQVKTTTGENPSASISLSNWKRMALERTAWFVVHVVLEAAEPRAVYVVHIDESQVARVLARLRSLPEDAPLNERTLDVTASDADRLAFPIQEGLSEALSKHLGQSEEGYSAAKSKWINETGYDDRPIAITVTTHAMDAATYYDMLADFVIGRIEELPIKALEVVEHRFGIGLPVKDLGDASGGTIRLDGPPPSLGTTVLTLTDRDRTERVSLKCTTHVAHAVVPFLPPLHGRVRLVSPFLELLTYPKDGDVAVTNLTLRVPGVGTLVSLSELAKACKAVRLLAGASAKGLRAELAFGRDVKQTLDLSGVAIEPDAEFLRFSAVMEDAARIARYFDLMDDVEVDPGAVLAQEFKVRTLAAAFDRAVGPLEVRVGVDVGRDAHGQTTAIILPAAVRLGGHVCAAGLAVVGTASWSKGSDSRAFVAVSSPEVRILYKTAVPNADWDAKAIEAKAEASARQLEAEGISLVLRP